MQFSSSLVLKAFLLLPQAVCPELGTFVIPSQVVGQLVS